MKFNIKPHIGVGNLKFGMVREEIRKILGEPEYSTERESIEYEDFSLPTPAQDGYFENELQITYDEDFKAIFFEFYGKDAEHLKVYLNGLDVFKIPAPQLIKKITATTGSSFDVDDREVPYSYVFPDIDLSVWRQFVPEQDEHNQEVLEADEGKYFWTIAIGKKGYYSASNCS